VGSLRNDDEFDENNRVDDGFSKLTWLGLRTRGLFLLPRNEFKVVICLKFLILLLTCLAESLVEHEEKLVPLSDALSILIDSKLGEVLRNCIDCIISF